MVENRGSNATARIWDALRHSALCEIVKVADMKYETVRKVTRRFKDGSTVTILADGTSLIKESSMDLMSDRKETSTRYTRKAPPPRSKDLRP